MRKIKINRKIKLSQKFSAWPVGFVIAALTIPSIVLVLLSAAKLKRMSQYSTIGLFVFLNTTWGIYLINNLLEILSNTNLNLLEKEDFALLIIYLVSAFSPITLALLLIRKRLQLSRKSFKERVFETFRKI